MPSFEGPEDINILNSVKIDSVDKESSLDLVSVQEVRDGTNGQTTVVSGDCNCLWSHA